MVDIKELDKLVITLVNCVKDLMAENAALKTAGGKPQEPAGRTLGGLTPPTGQSTPCSMRPSCPIEAHEGCYGHMPTCYTKQHGAH
jgi:hypothetical protein